MSKFKVGDKVKCVERWLADTTYGNVYTVQGVSELGGNLYFVYTDDAGDRPERLQSRFELVEHNPVLTPEEVFEHIHKGTKLQVRHNNIKCCWCDVVNPEITTYDEMLTNEWRIKPEPEIIELNGKKYREIVE